MSTQPLNSSVFRSIQIMPGDSLSSIANEILGDASYWREIASTNNIDIFTAIEIGQNITIPSKEVLERRARDAAAKRILNVNQDLQNRIKEIINSREAKVINRLMGFGDENRQNLLQSLDLSPLAKGLLAPTRNEELLDSIKNSQFDDNSSFDQQYEFRLVEWVL
ncbi:LysM domain-containing protein [Nostoc sp. PCC 7524]|uniref:LysM peptidoglycan-binding domain-containing protein n=1 Tax=Nostoc sp. (strain ATCC 29411 / PCC 7524) TaxID=28072 RepID=UPI00029EE768|nr:LysM domain-containing protein [Nostoc sp. PCC 7524]AFY49011.1 LysM domain-containing protein [Nostoc sp. PCC 7524]